MSNIYGILIPPTTTNPQVTTQQPQPLVTEYFNTFVTIFNSTVVLSSTDLYEPEFLTTHKPSSSTTNSTTTHATSTHDNDSSKHEPLLDTHQLKREVYKGSSRPVPLVNQPFQAFTIILILTLAILTNGSVILNISRDPLKLRMTHFLLIRHVCITDSIGALTVLPVPLRAFIIGHWDWGLAGCSAISTTTACCWTMHLVAVALYRADRVFAVWLPTGKYPVISAKIVNVLLVLIWLLALTGSYIATITFTPTFQPALALCIPNVPLVFFILVFGCYCAGLVTLTTGYVFAFITRRRKRRRKKKQAGTTNNDSDSVLQQQQPNLTSIASKSAPNLLNSTPPIRPGTPPTINNNHPCSNSVVLSTSSSTTSNNLPLTPPPLPTCTKQYGTHRRVQSDVTSIIPSNVQQPVKHETIVTIQYKSLRKSATDEDYDDDEDEARFQIEQSVAEKLDEFEEARASSSSNNSNNIVANNNEQVTHDQVEKVVSHTHNYHHQDNNSATRNPRCRVISSYAVSIGHLILYLPAMLVVGLLGPTLSPAVAFMCGTVVYCEFIVQPIALLLVSPKLRGEVRSMIVGIVGGVVGRVFGGSDKSSSSRDDTRVVVGGCRHGDNERVVSEFVGINNTVQE